MEKKTLGPSYIRAGGCFWGWTPDMCYRTPVVFIGRGLDRDREMM